MTQKKTADHSNSAALPYDAMEEKRLTVGRDCHSNPFLFSNLKIANRQQIKCLLLHLICHCLSHSMSPVAQVPQVADPIQP